MEWQPIETAPKDGTRIILFGDKYWPNPITSAKWHGTMWIGGPYDNASVNNPTHWMPFEAPNMVIQGAERSEAPAGMEG